MITDELRSIARTGPESHYDRNFISYVARTFTDGKAYPPERLAMAKMHGFAMRLSYLLFDDDESYAGMKKLDEAFPGTITVKDADALLDFVMKKEDYSGDRLPAITAALAVITAREDPADLDSYNRAFVRNWCTYCSGKE